VYARSTTIQANTSSIDDGIAHVRDVVMPAVLGTEGCVGLSLMVDRQSGRCIATTAWQTKEHMQASEQRVRSLRDQAAQIFGGTAQVEVWEIAVLHRDHHSREGACVRATWIQGEPGQVDRAVDVYKMVTLPALENLEGFCSASLMVDRASGRAVSSVVYDSIDAMQRTREQAGALRAKTTRDAGAEVLDVGEFELAIAHLNVPEMA
jgi:quinol monooxygenase YgiN